MLTWHWARQRLIAQSCVSIHKSTNVLLTLWHGKLGSDPICNLNLSSYTLIWPQNHKMLSYCEFLYNLMLCKCRIYETAHDCAISWRHWSIDYLFELGIANMKTSSSHHLYSLLWSMISWSKYKFSTTRWRKILTWLGVLLLVFWHFETVSQLWIYSTDKFDWIVISQHFISLEICYCAQFPLKSSKSYSFSSLRSNNHQKLLLHFYLCRHILTYLSWKNSLKVVWGSPHASSILSPRAQPVASKARLTAEMLRKMRRCAAKPRESSRQLEKDKALGCSLSILLLKHMDVKTSADRRVVTCGVRADIFSKLLLYPHSGKG